MAPRGLATVLRRLPAERRFAASRVPSDRYSPAQSRALFTPLTWSPTAFRAGGFRPPVPCASIQSLRDMDVDYSWPWRRCRFPQDLFARPHRPRAVEHRDCPPCGGDGGSIDGRDTPGETPDVLQRGFSGYSPDVAAEDFLRGAKDSAESLRA